MRPITVTAGPMPANAGVGSALGTGVPVAGPGSVQINLTGVPVGGSNTNTWQGTAQINNNVLTVISTVSGVMSPGTLMGNGLPPNIVVTGPGPNANQWYVSPIPQQVIGSIPMRLNNVITLDTPRQVAIQSTSDPRGVVTYTVYGTNAAGQAIQETNVSTGGVAFQTQQLFATVTQVVVTGSVGNMVNFGTSSSVFSAPVMFDPYTDVASISKAVSIVGLPTWSLQFTNDDPNSPTNPVPFSLMNWQPDPDTTNFVTQTVPRLGSQAFVPLWARLQLSSASPAGSSATATFVQQG